MVESIIEGVRDYIVECDLFDKTVNVDYLPEGGGEFSVNVSPTPSLITPYIRGGGRYQLAFTISSVNEYGADVLENLDNLGFFDKFTNWVEEQNNNNILPELPVRHTALEVYIESPGYLFEGESTKGKYQIECRLEYEKEGR